MESNSIKGTDSGEIDGCKWMILVKVMKICETLFLKVRKSRVGGWRMFYVTARKLQYPIFKMTMDMYCGTEMKGDFSK